MQTRQRFATRVIVLESDDIRERAIAAVRNAPLGIEVVLREKVRQRKPDQNALMWAGPLKDIAEQAWADGKQFPDTVWHEHFKIEYLPEDDDPDLDRLAKDSTRYHKWGTTPSGKKILTAGTGDLSVYGFSQYMEQVYADGANMGVMFHTKG